jgi:hypothetical protein
MRKVLLSVLAFVLIIPLSACASVTFTATPSPSVRPLPNISPTAPISDFPAVSPNPSPSDFVPDTDIPDDLGLSSSIVANSNDYLDCCLREDNANIYYTDYSDETDSENLTLYCINKQDGSVKVISQNCGCFTLYEGKIYYTMPYKSDYCNTIKCYDPTTSTERQILKLKNGIYGIAGYNGKLYFTYATVMNEGWDFPITDLYSINPNDIGKKMIQENVYSFCVYEDTIYYNESSWPDNAPLNQCMSDGSGFKRIYDETCSPGIAGNGIFFSDGIQDCVMDITAGNITRLPDNTDEIWQDSEYHRYTLLGKYVLCLTGDEQKPPSIIAFDTASGRIYKLLELTNNDYDLYTTPYGNYVVWTDNNGMISIDRIIISGGKASIEKYVVF